MIRAPWLNHVIRAPSQTAGTYALRRSRAYFGAHTATTVESLPQATTSSGYLLNASVSNFVLTGTGLVGSGTVNSSSPPPTGPGELQVATTYPDGSTLFLAQGQCNCSFRGLTGTATIRFFGKTSANGRTSGTFLVVSGGAGNGGLATLAGWGTFISAGQPAGTWKLVEHLRIT